MLRPFLPLFIVSSAVCQTYIVQTKPSYSYHSKYKAQFQALNEANNPVKDFKIGNFTGFMGEFDTNLMTSLFTDESVVAISEEKQLSLDTVITQEFAPLHLNKLSQTQNSSQFQYHSNAGIGVDVVVVDSGINRNHPDFTDRVKRIASFVEEEPQDDIIGHGTVVAGVVGSETFGVAKKCNLVDIKVTDSNRVTKLSNVILALELAVEQSKITNRPTVIVLAMSMASNSILDNAVQAVFDGGIPVIVSAGNSGELACERSPASASKSVSVGATNDRLGSVAKFSNWGACVDVFASGVDVIAPENIGDGVVKASGTSVSAGIVAGLAAYYMSLGDSGPLAVSKIKFAVASEALSEMSDRPNTVRKLARIEKVNADFIPLI